MLLADTDLQPRERVSWFRPGECLRVIYDVLREAPQPLTTRDVAGGVIAAKSIAIADDRTQALIQKTILASLSRAKNTIERLEAEGVVCWRGASGLSALPVTTEIDRGWASHCQSDDAMRLFAVADAAQVLAPGCFLA